MRAISFLFLLGVLLAGCANYQNVTEAHLPNGQRVELVTMKDRLWGSAPTSGMFAEATPGSNQFRPIGVTAGKAIETSILEAGVNGGLYAAGEIGAARTLAHATTSVAPATGGPINILSIAKSTGGSASVKP